MRHLGFYCTLVLPCALGLTAYSQEGVYFDEANNRAIYGGIQFELLAGDIRPDPNSIYLKDMSTEEERVLYRGKEVITDLNPAPDFSFLAFREAVLADDEEGLGTWNLHLINLDGEPFTTIENVFRFSWSPDGKHLAFIEGSADEEGVGFRSKAIGVLDMNDQENPTRYQQDAYDLNWATFDAALYILNMVDGEEVIHRFTLENRQFERTTHRGIYFSPNGELYYRPSYHASGMSVYHTEEDKPVQLDARSRSLLVGNSPGEDGTLFVQPTGWIDNSTLVFPSTKSENSNMDFELNVSASGATARSFATGERLVARPRTERGWLMVIDGKVVMRSDEQRSRSLVAPN